MSAKAIIIISDTHIGAGGAQQGNKLEDFISDEIFFDWVHRLRDESERTGAEMILVINGDWIEFLQVPEAETFDPSRIYEADAYRNRSEEAALKRLEIVHAGHPLIFQALADFLFPGPPRRSLVILFGNHDPELAYSGVQDRLLTLLGATGRKRDLVRIGERSFFEDGVYVEHGNAYTEQINRFTDPDHPFDPEEPTLIQRPPGSYVVTDFYNDIEWERPWIDGVHPMTSLVFYALAYDPAFAIRVVKAFLQAAPDLFGDIIATGAEEESESQRLLAEIESTDEQALAQRLAGDPDFAAEFSEQVARALEAEGSAPPEVAQAIATGGIGPALPEERAQDIAEQFWRALEAAAERVAWEQAARVVAFGHIHERIEKLLPGGAVYLNTGAWVWKANFSKSPDAVWRDLIAHPEKYMNQRHLTYARVDIAADGRITAAQLLLANDPPDPPAPPSPMPPAGLWARFVLAVRKIVAKATGWL